MQVVAALRCKGEICSLETFVLRQLLLFVYCRKILRKTCLACLPHDRYAVF